MLLAQRFIPASTCIPALEGFVCHNARILWSAPDHNTMHAPRPPSPVGARLPPMPIFPPTWSYLPLLKELFLREFPTGSDYGVLGNAG